MKTDEDEIAMDIATSYMNGDGNLIELILRTRLDARLQGYTEAAQIHLSAATEYWSGSILNELRLEILAARDKLKAK